MEEKTIKKMEFPPTNKVLDALKGPETLNREETVEEEKNVNG